MNKIGKAIDNALLMVNVFSGTDRQKFVNLFVKLVQDRFDATAHDVENGREDFLVRVQSFLHENENTRGKVYYDDLDGWEISDLKGGNKLNVIKGLRDRTNCSLISCKRFVEKWQELYESR